MLYNTTIISVFSFLLTVLEPGVGRGPGAEAAAALQGVRHGAIHRGPGQTGHTLLRESSSYYGFLFVKRILIGSNVLAKYIY